MFYNCFTKKEQHCEISNFVKHTIMATVNHTILKHQKKSDNTWNVKLRITQNRQSAYLPTRHYVSMEMINKKTFELKERNNPIYDSLVIEEARIRQEFSRMENLDSYNAKQLAEYIDNFLKGKSNTKINLFDYGYLFAQKAIDAGRSIGTTYKITMSKFESFVGDRNFSFTDLTSSHLKQFEAWLRSNKTRNGGVMTDTGVCLYLTTLHTIFQNGKKEFNDEERNLIRIPNSPFSAYTIPKNNPTTKKALSVEQIRSIIEFETNEIAPMIARDVFVMSFLMIGMNTVDMYYLGKPNLGRFDYERRKTKGRREDKAFISIKHEPELLPYIERYKDSLGDRAFNFFMRYKSHIEFNRLINFHLKTVGKAVGIPDLTFYSARHSWATIARNNCGISVDDVASCLNHVNSERKVTDIYIKKDWSIIDRANRKVLDFVFHKEEVKEKAGG